MKKVINNIVSWSAVLLPGSIILGTGLWLLGFIWIEVIELWSAIL